MEEFKELCDNCDTHLTLEGMDKGEITVLVDFDPESESDPKAA